MINIIKIQQELKVPKSQRNTFGNYNYRSCEDILEAVKPLLDKYSLLMTISDEVVNIGDRNYVKATVTITDGDKSITTSAFACESREKKGMDSAQITGAASSYARKYALNGMFAIDDTKDADTMDNSKVENKVSTPTTQSESTNECLHAEFSVKKVSKEGPTKGKYFKLCNDCNKFIGWMPAGVVKENADGSLTWGSDPI